MQQVTALPLKHSLTFQWRIQHGQILFFPTAQSITAISALNDRFWQKLL